MESLHLPLLVKEQGLSKDSSCLTYPHAEDCSTCCVLLCTALTGVGVFSSDGLASGLLPTLRTLRTNCIEGLSSSLGMLQERRQHRLVMWWMQRHRYALATSQQVNTVFQRHKKLDVRRTAREPGHSCCQVQTETVPLQLPNGLPGMGAVCQLLETTAPSTARGAVASVANSSCQQQQGQAGML